MLKKDEAKELVRGIFEEAVNQGHTDVIGELYTDAFIDHAPGPDQEPGPAGIVNIIKQYRAAIPDLTITIEDVIVADD